jgi:O-antigen/teichoic acid export membrane protein
MKSIISEVGNRIKGFLQKPIVRKVVGAIFTQGLLSMTSFLIGIVMARYTDKEEYGLYILLFSFIGIAGNIQNAFANSPLTVLYSARDEQGRKDLVTGVTLMQFLLFIPLGILVIAGITIYGYISGNRGAIATVVILVLAGFSYLGKEYMRTIHYVHLKIGRVIRMDFAFTLSVFLMIGALLYFKQISCNTALIALFAGYTVSMTAGLLSNLRSFGKTAGVIGTVFKDTWQYARWALIGVASGIVQQRSYLYIVSSMLGLERLADVSAARLLLMPVGLVVASSVKIVIANGSDLINNGEFTRFRKFILFILMLLAGFWLVYGVNLLIFYTLIVRILGEKYSNIQSLVILWSLFFLFNALRFPLKNSLIVLKKFKLVTLNDMIAGAVTLVSCFTFVWLFDEYGAVMSLAIGEFLLCILSLVLYLKYFPASKDKNFKAPEGRTG